MTWTWDFGSASVRRTRVSPDVLMLEVHGLVTDSMFAALRGDLCEAVSQFAGHGVVLDLRMALLLGLEQARLLLPQPASRLDWMALALVVKAEDQPTFLGMCDRAAEDGRVNAVFTELSRACEWARARGQAMASLREQQ